MTKGFIYFIQAESGGPIKIGYAENVTLRLKSIQTMSPVKLIIISLMNGDIVAEKHLHRYFGKFRLHGEWFLPSEELINFIKCPFQIECNMDTGDVCNGICRNGQSCRRQRCIGTNFCVSHQRQVDGIPDGWILPRLNSLKQKCKAITKAGRICTCFVMKGQSYCVGHINTEKVQHDRTNHQV